MRDPLTRSYAIAVPAVGGLQVNTKLVAVRSSKRGAAKDGDAANAVATTAQQNIATQASIWCSHD